MRRTEEGGEPGGEVPILTPCDFAPAVEGAPEASAEPAMPPPGMTPSHPIMTHGEPWGGMGRDGGARVWRGGPVGDHTNTDSVSDASWGVGVG